MKMKKNKQLPQITRGRVDISVPHEGRNVSFVYPSAGPNAYKEVGRQILNQGLRLPTGDETASLLYSAYCIPQVKDEPEFQNIREIMNNRWLWVFNLNLWTRKGVY